MGDVRTERMNEPAGRESVPEDEGAHGHAGAASDDAVRWGAGVLPAGALGARREEFRAELHADLEGAEDRGGAELLAEARGGAGAVPEAVGAVRVCVQEAGGGE